jgi:hypothetical protein
MKFSPVCLLQRAPVKAQNDLQILRDCRSSDTTIHEKTRGENGLFEPFSCDFVDRSLPGTGKDTTSKQSAPVS